MVVLQAAEEREGSCVLRSSRASTLAKNLPGAEADGMRFFAGIQWETVRAIADYQQTAASLRENVSRVNQENELY